ncbi:MAG: type II toxin-antitoxin system Phd/YefM family antitoxin [Acidimicrobiaceae bacterium]|nr:type II toxin-antitoxin system Phd/YefM family antitoxin [Acidimicrobiaceae bacterium]
MPDPAPVTRALRPEEVMSRHGRHGQRTVDTRTRPSHDGGAGCSAGHKMYDSYMNEVAVSEARNRLAEVIEESRRSGEPISVTRRGRRVAVILDSAAFDRLVESADEAEDRRELAAARDDDDYVPWDEVKAALGLE